MIHVTGAINFDCEYIEQIAERLTEFYGREVLVSDYESHLEPSGNDFIIFGNVWHQCLKKNEQNGTE